MSAPKVLQRPILGGPFGAGRYALATVSCMTRGLHTVKYLVVEPAAGAVLAVATEKTEALATARRVLHAASELARLETLASGDEDRQGQLWPNEAVFDEPPPGKRRPVSRRRRDVFEKSDGHCHYCAAALTLDGRWHVEHMMPRALGGADEIGNLVAACAPCNLAKRDRTALEFIISQAERVTL